MTLMNPALLLALAGALSGALIAAVALTISNAPGWRELRSFALVAAAAAVYCLLALVHVLPMSSSTRLLGERLLFAASFVYAMAWIRHLAVSDKRPLRQLERGAMIVGTVMVVLALVPDVLVVPPVRQVRIGWFGVTYEMATATTLGVVCVGLTVIAVVTAAFAGGRRWRDGWHSRQSMIGATALALTGVSDTLASMHLIPMPQLVEAVTVAVVGGMGIFYARRFIADARRLEALSTKLEHEVASRTDELLTAHAEIARHERLAGLGRVAAGVAHEINNPTTVIQQNLEQLRTALSESGKLSPELAARLDRSRSATRRIADIVRQLLETGREARAGVRTTSFLVAPVVENAKAAASASVPELRVSGVISESLCALGDPALVEQVLINLLINAAHAAKDAPGGGHVEIVGTRLGERVRLAVKDNGSGIPAAIRDRLFEPFATTKPVGQGTGLGLAVSRGLMTRQGGSLFVAQSTEAGTEMVLELPAAEKVEPGELTSASAARSAASTEEAPREPTSKKDIRVLVIDDDDDLREVLVLQLGSHFHVEEAATVDQALAMVADGHTYDVVLCDLMMPRVGAEGWLSSCTSLDPRIADHTIVLTGGPTTKEASALVEARRDKVIFKPFEITHVQAMIERVARS